jgi:hypothetical protein
MAPDCGEETRGSRDGRDIVPLTDEARAQRTRNPRERPAASERGKTVLESRSRCIRRTREDRLIEISGYARTKSR